MDNLNNLNQPEFAVPEKIDAKIKKSVFELDKKDTFFAVSTMAVCVFVSLFGIFSGFALGYLAASVLMVVLGFVYFAKKGKVNAFAVLCGVLSVGCTSVFLLTSNVAIKFFGVIICFLLGLVCFDGLSNGKTKGNLEAISVFNRSAETLGNVGIAARSIFSSDKNGKRSVGKAFLGLAGALPVLVIIIPLLINSDAAFKGMMSSIFKDAAATIFKIIFGTGLGLFVITYGFSVKKYDKKPTSKSKFLGIENVYVISFLSAISACYLLYLFSQLAYFFGAFKGFLPEEYSLADYARQGFFEMCAIAVINLVIVFLSVLLSKKKEGRVSGVIKAFDTFITLFTLLIVATAMSKMVLYIDGYGMTVLRLCTSAFMLFLAVVFVAVILKIYFTRVNVVKTGLVTAAIIVLLLGAFNVNAVCAKYNFERYMSGKSEEIDVLALYELGDEGIPYLAKLACIKDEEIAHEAKTYLAEAYLYEYFDDQEAVKEYTTESLKSAQSYKGIDRFSIPKDRAYEALYALVKNNPDFGAWCYEQYNFEFDYEYEDEYEYQDEYDYEYDYEEDVW